MSGGRACIRGCTVRDVHYATCPDFGKDDGDCKGCAPRVARDGALICERCYRSLRKHLEDAPDVVGHLRAIADPTKAGAIDRSNPSTRLELPAPVAADLVDASDDIVRTLRAWVLFIDGEPVPERLRGLDPGADAASAHDLARELCDVILADLDRIVNDAESVALLWEGVAARHQEREPAVWTVADALARWSFEDRARWADKPCPECDIMTVRVSPPRRRGAATRYVCKTCGWLANSTDDGGLWRDVFEVVQLVRPHDPRWLTLAAAARLAKVTAGTVRKWGQRDLVKTENGRYWRDDVAAVAESRRGDVIVTDEQRGEAQSR